MEEEIGTAVMIRHRETLLISLARLQPFEISLEVNGEDYSHQSSQRWQSTLNLVLTPTAERLERRTAGLQDVLAGDAG